MLELVHPLSHLGLLLWGWHKFTADLKSAWALCLMKKDFLNICNVQALLKSGGLKVALYLGISSKIIELFTMSGPESGNLICNNIMFL